MPVQQWQNIVGATSSIFLVNGTSDVNDEEIRCVIYNSGGSITSNNFTIDITSPDSSSGDSTNNTLLIAVLAGGIGGGLLAFCLLLIIILVVLIFVVRRRRSPYRKLKEPDWEEVAFGDVKEDISIPKKLLEVNPFIHCSDLDS